MTKISKITDKKGSIFDLDSESKFFLIIIVLLSILFVILVLGESEGIFDESMSRVFGRVIGFFILMILAHRLIIWTSRMTEKPESWEKKKEAKSDENLQIKEISTLLDRASDGKSMSQKILHDKIKEIFFTKLKDEKDLDKEELNRLLKNPEEFRKVVQDDKISDFILSIEGKEKSKLEDKDMDKAQYKKRVRKMIKRIKEWE